MTDIQFNIAPEETNETEASQTRDSSTFTLLELVGDPTEAIIHDREITVNGNTALFHIKQLSMKECTEIDAKKYNARKPGQAERDIAAEGTSATAWLLHRCVVKNTGTIEKPNWGPLWPLDEIKGRPPEFDGKGSIVREHPGLLGNPTKAAQELINKLTIACWEVNEELNPFRQAQALKLLGID